MPTLYTENDILTPSVFARKFWADFSESAQPNLAGQFEHAAQFRAAGLPEEGVRRGFINLATLLAARINLVNLPLIGTDAQNADAQRFAEAARVINEDGMYGTFVSSELQAAAGEAEKTLTELLPRAEEFLMAYDMNRPGIENFAKLDLFFTMDKYVRELQYADGVKTGRVKPPTGHKYRSGDRCVACGGYGDVATTRGTQCATCYGMGEI